MSQKKQSVQEYLDQHQINAALNGVLNRLVQSKPANPWEFLSREFAAMSAPSSASSVPAEEKETEVKEVVEESKELPAPSPSSSKQPVHVVFVLGGPGSGKGTQCERIIARYPFVHLSAGDLLREARQTPGETADLIESYIKEGKIVPAEITVGLLRSAMERHVSSETPKHHFLVDGFPRSLDNWESWRSVMQDFAAVRFVLHFACAEEVMVARCLERGKTSGRSDDNEESIRKRLVTLRETTQPVLDEFVSLNMVRNVDAEMAPDQVFEKVVELFDSEKFE